MRSCARFLSTIVATLVASGVLATVARGDECAVTLRWSDMVYTSADARFAVLEPGSVVTPGSRTGPFYTAVGEEGLP